MKDDLQPPPDYAELVEAGYQQALALLRRNATPAGILAASNTAAARKRHYATIFGRDAAICALGMVASGKVDLIACARAGLLTLGRAQAANGQIPNYVDPAGNEVDFWYTGCIDATLWWLIAVAWLERVAPDAGLGQELTERIARARQWLACQEHPAWGLLQQNEASDWADIMPRSGFVLYSNALWYRVKRLYGEPGAQRTREVAAQLFQPFGKPEPAERRLRLLTRRIREGGDASPFLLSFVNLSGWGNEADLFANLLAALSGLVEPEQGAVIADAILQLEAHRPYPLRAVGRPILPDDPLWRPYMLRHQQNRPWQYHNGAIWPFIGGFWVLLLQRLGREELARRELAALARANSVNDWEFNEWFQGQNGQPMGMAGQSWNAAMYLLAFQAQQGRFAWEG